MSFFEFNSSIHYVTKIVNVYEKIILFTYVGILHVNLFCGN